jgi:tRNA (guanine-N7-)-methyltransferase
VSLARPARPSLLSPLASILERLEFAALFPQTQPVEVELGCGDASFLVEYAARHPERNFLGVERLLGRLRKLDRKGARAGLSNLRGLRIEASYCLEYLLPAESIHACHVYFPDPWPKRRHWRRRLVNERFPLLCQRALVLGGLTHVRTDDPDYFAQMQRVFRACPAFEAGVTPAELAGVTTDFEREFLGRGVPTLRASYRRAA